MQRAEPLASFLERTASSDAAPYLEALRARARELNLQELDAPAELARMRAYIIRYYQGVTPTHSFAKDDGTVIDCVPFEQQPAARAARSLGHELLPSAPPPASVPGVEGPQQAPPRALPAAPALSPCPAGNVPVQRITLERLVAAGTLDRFFHKEPPSA